MWRYFAERLLILLPVLLGVSFVIFLLLYITPGDPARVLLGEVATQEAVEKLREQMGLNHSFFVQYLNYLRKAVLQLDIGRSYVTKRPVLQEIINVFPTTLRLALLATALAILIGIPLGITSAIKQYSLFDNLAMLFALIGISMPVFWLGILLILFFSVHLGWFPASGFGSFRAMVLPAITLSTPSLAIISRMTRSSMLEVIRQDYIRTARAKGQKESVVIWQHALGNALIPIVTIVGLQFGSLLEGAVLTETVFSIPGVGRLLVEAIKTRDYPMIQGAVLFLAFTFSLINLLVDILYAYIDPRIKAEYQKRSQV